MRYILFLFIFATILPSYAAENNSLVVYLNSGATLLFPVAEKPQLTFEGSILCINTNRYQISDVKKYTFSKNEATGLQEIEGGENKLDFNFLEGEKISIRVKDPSVVVRIYSSNGIEHAVKRESGTNGSIVVDMASLMPDVYIIAVGEETIKIRKR